MLDSVVPGFDDIDKRASLTVHAGTPLVVPLTIRVALLAGLSRTQNNPDLCKRMESACIGRERIRFDAVMIKLLADAHPSFSHLQQIRELKSFLVSPFPAASAQNRASLTISYNVTAVGRTEDTALTAFTDGCSGLRRILADAGVTEAPVLDWFHIAMRLQHLEQTASGLSADDPARVAAKAVIVAEVERLHWRLWNGKANDAQISIGRIRAVMHHFQGEPGQRRAIAPSRKLWTALHALDGYLTGQSDWLVNYARAVQRSLLSPFCNTF